MGRKRTSLLPFLVAELFSPSEGASTSDSRFSQTRSQAPRLISPSGYDVEYGFHLDDDTPRLSGCAQIPTSFSLLRRVKHVAARRRFCSRVAAAVAGLSLLVTPKIITPVRNPRENREMRIGRGIMQILIRVEKHVANLHSTPGSSPDIPLRAVLVTSAFPARLLRRSSVPLNLSWNLFRANFYCRYRRFPEHAFCSIKHPGYSSRFCKLLVR